ncbi:hypothetical protein GCK32_007169 [Trichostrongylus colubriformis]|uniref:Uncharacterized protein n=1 Tax=Trichostrongylus colubriformis TaxID=6319 RepID=A0AAN8FY45_TRICO
MDSSVFKSEIRRIIRDRIATITKELHSNGRRWADMFTEEDSRAIETYTIESVGESEQEAAEREGKRKEKDRSRIRDRGNIHQKKLSANALTTSCTSPSDEKLEMIPEDPAPYNSSGFSRSVNEKLNEPPPSNDTGKLCGNEPQSTDAGTFQGSSDAELNEMEVDNEILHGSNVLSSSQTSSNGYHIVNGSVDDNVFSSGKNKPTSDDMNFQQFEWKPLDEDRRQSCYNRHWRERRMTWRETHLNNSTPYTPPSKECQLHCTEASCTQQSVEWRPYGMEDVSTQFNSGRFSCRVNWRGRNHSYGFNNRHRTQRHWIEDPQRWDRYNSMSYAEVQYYHPYRDLTRDGHYPPSYLPSNRRLWRRSHYNRRY